MYDRFPQREAPPTGVLRVGEHPLWSTYHFQPQNYIEKAVLFDAQKGASGQGKRSRLTYADTNLSQPRHIPGGQAFEVEAVAWEIFSTAEPDLHYVGMSGVLRWNFLQTDIDIAPLSSLYGYFPPSPKPSPFEQLANVEEMLNSFQTVRVGKVCLMRGMLGYTKTPVLLPMGSSFTVTAQFDDPFVPEGTGALRVYLHGRFRTVIEVG